MEVMGNNKADALKNLMAMMGPKMQEHWDQKHPGQPMPSLEDAQKAAEMSLEPVM